MNIMTSADDFARLQEVLAGTWSIERELGRGGMGTVYLARDVALDRPVAIKVLHPHLAEQPEHRGRFLREARTGARLSHPHIVPIYAVEERDGFVLLVMGLVDGESVGDRVRREGPIPPSEAARILREIGWGLAYAHAMNLVHRDVTIDNVLIERGTGRALLADFGIAAEIDGAGNAPLIGTPAYLAPEIIRGDPPSPQSDLYALGVFGWTILAGRTPFAGDDSGAVLLMHLTDDAPSLLRAAPATPSRLVRAVESALAKEPGERASSMEQWLELLHGGNEATALAEPLHRWVNRWELVRPFYALGMSVTAMLTAGMSETLLQILGMVFGDRSYAQLSDLIPLVLMIATVLSIVIVVHVGIELAILRRLARDGYDHHDLQLALARSRQELRRAGPRTPSLLGRVVHDVGWLSAGFFVLLGAALIEHLWFFLPAGHDRYGVYLLLHSIGQWAYVAFWSALGFSFLVPSFHFKPDGLFVRLRDAFWGSRLAYGLMRLASIGLPRVSAPEHTLHRPTELVLDLAIDDLWQALPATTRAGMSDTPRIVSDLRRRVSEVREMERVIDDTAITPTPETRDLRERLATRHEAGVTALERIRLLLARLGSAAAPAGEFTAQLEDARAVEQSLLVELGAHAGLLKLLKKGIKVATLTPTPVG